ncbi:DNA mismatch repair endonuclease MutL [Dehalobacter sp. DCM]|uniref:DNA mismatch repair endonuclease MutL n=1 Tax=Dehalobacter sp. DCM TaxID=2907827 RepID=UPI00308121D1|nr:DNA mismatch repair endonuclease MutL [Dehalobacter sp. DCM]
MVSRIKLLDAHCINQIAAGEVVERPLSVVKELVENSLDAGARKIEIAVEGSGTSLIRIKDDGAGILAEDLRLAVLPHATSKITAITDLDHLQTLGFRGEALPSIASVSKLTIVTRTPDAVSGQELTVEGGTFISLKETGCPYGTMVTVKELFYNTPARQKFLRSASTEFGSISDMVSRLALSRPDVAFSLRHPTNLILKTPGNGNLLDTIAAVNGNETARQMVAISDYGENRTITGYVSRPENVRSSRSSMTFIVNGRVIRSPLLNQAVKDGYHTLIPAGMYPVSILSLTMDPLEYDVNVHPAKLEIKFKAEKELSRQLADVVRKALLECMPVRRLTMEKRKDDTLLIHESTPSYRPENGRDTIRMNKAPQWEQAKILYQPQDNENLAPYLHNNYNENVNNGFIRPEEIAATRIVSGNEMSDTPNSESAAKSIGQPVQSIFVDVYAIGQVFNTYILAADGIRLYIIDQHAAHERIRYEELLKAAKLSESVSQQLLIPETMEMTAQEEQILLAHFDDLRDMGFIIEHFGDRTYFLRGVPVLNTLDSPGKVFKNFLDVTLNTSYAPSREKMMEEWIYMMACRSAVKGRERLAVQEMDDIIQTLGKTENPYSCPHGRPTIIEITMKELAQRFGRE